MAPRTLRPLGPSDLPHVHALAVRPETARSVGGSAFDGPARWEGLLRGCLEERTHAYGLLDGLTLRAAAFLQPGRRRRLHCAHVTFLLLRGEAAGDDGAELLAAVTEIASRWMGFARLEVEALAADAVFAEVAARAGWLPEVVRRGGWKQAGPTDVVEYAWLRSDLRASPTAPKGGHGPKRPPLDPSEVSFRGVRPEDAPFYVAMQQQESVIRGTLQVPTTPPEAWARRIRGGQDAGTCTILGSVQGRPAGLISLHRFPPPRAHAAGLGMFVHDDFQGRGLGRLLVDRALRAADEELGIDRVELDVYPDNDRALRLYQATGFEEEGVRRCMAWCDGGYADAVAMARRRPGA